MRLIWGRSTILIAVVCCIICRTHPQGLRHCLGLWPPVAAWGLWSMRHTVGQGFIRFRPHSRRSMAICHQRKKLAAAEAVFETLPDGHMFARNAHVVDHTSGDAGFYDLLLHSTDRPYAVSELLDELKGAGLGLVDLLAPSAYDPALYGVVDHGLDWMTAMSVAEQLSGSMKVHVGYAVPDARGAVSRAVARPDQVPHLDGTRNDPKLANKLAQVIANSGSVPIVQGEVTLKLAVPKGIARAVAGINGRRSLAELQAGSGLEQGSFDTAWAALDDALCGWSKMWYSRLLRR